MARQYILFYSWQSDMPESRRILNKAIKDAKKTLLKKEGIELVIDQDARNRTGKRDLANDILKKIENCHIFLADLTPVTLFKTKRKTDPVKLMPNCNVMYEYGYALGKKGENKMIPLAMLKRGKHANDLPFDINHDTLTIFKKESDLADLWKWIKNICDQVDKENLAIVPEYHAYISLVVNDELKDSITVNPIFKHNVNRGKVENKERPKTITHEEALQALIAGDGMKMAEYTVQHANVVKPISIKPITKDIYHSYAPITFAIHNDGNAALKNVLLQIQVPEGVKLLRSNEKSKLGIEDILRPQSVIISDNEIHYKYETLNPQVIHKLCDAFIFLPHEMTDAQIKWFISTEMGKFEGEVMVHSEPRYKECEAHNPNKPVGEEWYEDYVEGV